MLVKIKGELEYLGDLEFEASSLKEILSLIKLNFGEEVSDKILYEKYFYLVGNTENLDEAVILHPEVILSDLSAYDILYIIPEISGEFPVAAIAAFVGGTLGAVGIGATILTYALVLAQYLVIGLAVNAIMSALSPTPEYQGDAAQSKKNLSNLFSGAPIIREQGGPVPLLFGNPYAGGVLISSGVSTI